MDISIDSLQVQRWADFSGDYNRIHFEHAAARALGADGPLVHGMLPIIMMLSHAENYLDVAPGAARSARLRLKRPLEIGRAARIESQSHATKPSALVLALKSELGTHTQGTFVSGDAPEASPALHCDEWVHFRDGDFSLDGSSARRAASAFERVLPSVRTPWLVLSSYAFGEFLRRANAELSAAALGLLAHPRRDRLAVVQTGYGIDIAATHTNAHRDFKLVECFSQPAALVRLEHGCNASCQVRVLRDQEPWFDVHVQLFMKMLSAPEARVHSPLASASPALR